jgi:hypothetical protein
MKKTSVPSADSSALHLAAQLKEKTPFLFMRFGDGAIECMRRKGGQTADGEVYSEDLACDLTKAWIRACSLGVSREVYIGDWLSADFRPEDQRYEKEWRGLRAIAESHKCSFLHFEALLFHRRQAESLMSFYRAVQTDDRRKLLVAPADMAKAAHTLGCSHLMTPMSNLHQQVDWLEDELRTRAYDVCIYGAGMAVHIPVVNVWKDFPQKTFVNIGSSLDPVCRGRRTRNQQIEVAEARELFFTRLAHRPQC